MLYQVVRVTNADSPSQDTDESCIGFLPQILNTISRLQRRKYRLHGPRSQGYYSTHIKQNILHCVTARSIGVEENRQGLS